MSNIFTSKISMSTVDDQDQRLYRRVRVEGRVPAGTRPQRARAIVAGTEFSILEVMQ